MRRFVRKRVAEDVFRQARHLAGIRKAFGRNRRPSEMSGQRRDGVRRGGDARDADDGVGRRRQGGVGGGGEGRRRNDE